MPPPPAQAENTLAGSLDAWRSLATHDGSKLMQILGPDPGLSQIQLARKTFSPEAVAAGVECVRARAKAVRKLGEPWAECFADVSGVEMASGPITGTHKADRFTKAGLPVLDLCAGIGADSERFAKADLDVKAIEWSEVRAWMCEKNTGVRTIVDDATRVDLDGHAIHLDPQRRSDMARSWSLDDLEPGIEFVQTLSERKVSACIKLGPGVDVASLPEGEIEIVSERGTLTQALLWTGGFAEVGLRATLLDGETHGYTFGSPGERAAGYAASAEHAGRLLFECDPALERLGLACHFGERFGAFELRPGLGLLTGDEDIASAWVSSLEIHADMAYSERRLRDWLSANDGGLVEVKTRGKAADSDVLQKRLRGSGDILYTVFVFRDGQGRGAPVRTLVTTRCSPRLER